MNKYVKNILIGLLVFYILFQILTLNSKKDRQFIAFNRVIQSATLPIQKAHAWVIRRFNNAWSSYVDLRRVAQENKKLKKQIITLQAESIKNKEMLLEAERVRALFKVEKIRDYDIEVARRIAASTSVNQKLIRIDKGTKFGFQKQMPVTHPKGLIGLLIDVSPWHSDILTLTDKSSIIDVINQRTRKRALLRGFGLNTLKAEFFSVSQDIKIGDVFISSGLDESYPKGFPVGFVSDVAKADNGLFLDVMLKTYADFSHIEEVAVIRDFE